MIKQMTSKDKDMVAGWWRELGLDPKNLDYPLFSSFIAFKNQVTLYAVSLQLVVGSKVAYIDGFIRNPNTKTDITVVDNLHDHISKFAKSMGYERFHTITSYPEVVKRDTELGYKFYS